MFDSVLLGLNSSSSTSSDDDEKKKKKIDSMNRFVWDDIVGEVMMIRVFVVVDDSSWMVQHKYW